MVYSTLDIFTGVVFFCLFFCKPGPGCCNYSGNELAQYSHEITLCDIVRTGHVPKNIIVKI